MHAAYWVETVVVPYEVWLPADQRLVSCFIGSENNEMVSPVSEQTKKVFSKQRSSDLIEARLSRWLARFPLGLQWKIHLLSECVTEKKVTGTPCKVAAALYFHGTAQSLGSPGPLRIMQILQTPTRPLEESPMKILRKTGRWFWWMTINHLICRLIIGQNLKSKLIANWT